MIAFNTRIKDFGNGQKQIIIYDELIRGNKTCKDLTREIPTSDEIIDNFQDYSPIRVKEAVHKLTVNENRLCECMNEEEYQSYVKRWLEQRNINRMKNNKRNKILVYDKARSNRWDWFVTFTFNSSKVNRQSYDECYKALSQWLNNIRKRCSPDIKYLFVPELHKDGLCWHWHGLLADCEELEFTQAVNHDTESPLYGTSVYHKGRLVYNLPQWRYGFSTATKVRDTKAVSKYICKYISKQTHTLLFGRNRHISSRNLNMPTVEYTVLSPEEIDILLNSINPVYQQDKEIKNTMYPNTMHIYELEDDLE